MMIRILSALVFIFQFYLSQGQSRYALPDSIAAGVRVTDVSKLHLQLTNDLSSNEDKARAFYSWIARNIQYDVEESLKRNKDNYRQEPDFVVKSGKAVCHGYAALFKQWCDQSGIPCYLVSGYTKLDGMFDDAGHTWNIVYINNKWQPVDITWGAGGINPNGKYIREFSDAYFLTAPKDFLKDHYPFDPMWQLVEHPVKLTIYRSAGWSYNEHDNLFFSYNDTIAAWQTGDSLEREYSAAARMLRFNPGDPLMKEHYSLALFMKANADFDKGNKIMEVLYPRNHPTVVKPLSPEKKLYKAAQLDSIDMFYQKAAAFYTQVQLRNSSDQAVLKNNIAALKYNRDVVKREKAQLNR